MWTSSLGIRLKLILTCSSRHQLTKGKAPIESVTEQDKQANLKNPMVEETNEASAVARGDEQYKHTAEIASHVSERLGDEYGQKSRPPASTVNSQQSLGGRPTTLEKMQQKTDSESTRRSNESFKGQGRTHVLLVEDNVINQRILKRKLEAKKYLVTVANNGREAVDSVMKNLSPENVDDDESRHFDIVLMDQEMPVLDGNAATREIRQLEGEGEVLRVPILGVTANVREPQKDEMKEAGMDDVISKPYSMEALIGKIDGLVLHEKEVQSGGVSPKEGDKG